MKLSYKTNLRLAVRLTKKLIKTPNNTIFLFQLLHATNSPSLKWTYHKLLETSNGGEIAYSSEEVCDYFPTLKTRPDDSVGKHCSILFPDQETLIRISKRKSAWIEVRHPYNWMSRRYRDTHDTWHVLTGYDTEIFGEMCLAMFSYAQTKALGWLLISLIGWLHRGAKFSDIRPIFEAYRNGKRAKFLLAENYNDLFNENLSEARKRLNIRKPEIYDRISKN